MSPIPPGWRFEIDKQDISSSRWTRGTGVDQLELGDGKILLRIDRFGFTANNLTYAIYGDSFGYWRFFPALPGWGIIPVWGYADVVRSNCANLCPGERIFGYLPMADHLVVQPSQITAASFRDDAAHRSTLPQSYNDYRRVAADPRHAPQFEARQALLKPLLTLSWLVAEMLVEAAYYGADQVVITSASSRTALGIARALQSAHCTVPMIGVTSAANRDFVEARRVFEMVFDYDQASELPVRPTIIIDLSGSHTVLQRLHAHLDGAILRSIRVGDTSQAGKPVGRIAGPEPILFFAPDEIRGRRRAWGTSEYQRRYETAWDMLSAWMADWLVVDSASGLASIEQVYHAIRTGSSSPERAHLCRLAG